MAGGNSNPTTGSGTTPNQPSWAGGPINTNYSPEAFGQRLGGDIATIYGQGPKVFNKSLYAGMGDTTQQGLASMLGVDPSTYMGGLTGAMSDYADVAAGKQIGLADPNYDRLRSKLMSDVSGDVNSTFSNSGRFGGGSHVTNLTSGLADSVAAMDYGQLQDSYSRQNTALGALPGIYQAMMAPGQTQLGVGQLQDQDAQAKLTAENDLFRRTNDAGYNHLAQNLNLLNTGSGNGGVIQQPSNPLFDILGTGISLAGMFL